MATRTYTWTTSANGTAGNKWGGVWTIPSASKIWLFGANTPTGDLHYAGKITHIKLQAYLDTGGGMSTWRGYVVGNGGNTVVDGSFTYSNWDWVIGGQTLIDKDVSLDGLSFLDKNKLLGVCITYTGTTTSDTILANTTFGGMAKLTITYTPASIISYRNGNNWQLVKPYYYVNGNWVNCKVKYYSNGSWIDTGRSLS